MNKTWQLEDFKIAYGQKEIITWGQTIRGEYECNYSSILTTLIHEAGRWCEGYASDLFLDWNEVLNDMKKGETKSYLFGFQRSGVDPTQYVLNNFNTRIGTLATMLYSSIWRLDMECKERETTMKLYRVH